MSHGVRRISGGPGGQDLRAHARREHARWPMHGLHTRRIDRCCRYHPADKSLPSLAQSARRDIARCAVRHLRIGPEWTEVRKDVVLRFCYESGCWTLCCATITNDALVMMRNTLALTAFAVALHDEAAGVQVCILSACFRFQPHFFSAL